MAGITSDHLLARRAELEEAERRLWADLNATLGAKAEVDLWLGVLARPEVVPSLSTEETHGT